MLHAPPRRSQLSEESEARVARASSRFLSLGSPGATAAQTRARTRGSIARVRWSINRDEGWSTRLPDPCRPRRLRITHPRVRPSGTTPSGCPRKTRPPGIRPSVCPPESRRSAPGTGTRQCLSKALSRRRQSTLSRLHSPLGKLLFMVLEGGIPPPL